MFHKKGTQSRDLMIVFLALINVHNCDEMLMHNYNPSWCKFIWNTSPILLHFEKEDYKGLTLWPPPSDTEEAAPNKFPFDLISPWKTKINNLAQ